MINFSPELPRSLGSGVRARDRHAGCAWGSARPTSTLGGSRGIAESIVISKSLFLLFKCISSTKEPLVCTILYLQHVRLRDGALCFQMAALPMLHLRNSGCSPYRYVRSLPVRSICTYRRRQLRLPLVSVCKQLLCTAVSIHRSEGHVVGTQATNLCCTAVLLSSPSRTRRSATRQSHRRGTTPGRSRSKCTWSCRCRSESCGGCRQPALPPRL
jgi:hypothetical protein